jgi:hypothetical protein
MAATGRGLILHGDAFGAIASLRGESHRAIARASAMSPSHLSDLIAHRSGASEEVVERLSIALDVNAPALFPQLVGWQPPAEVA